MQPLQIGIVGAGFNANFHLKALQYVRGVQVVAITAPAGADVTAENARAMGLGNPQIYDSPAEMAQRSNVQAIMLCMPNFARLDVMRQIREGVSRRDPGYPLLGIACEKPLARNVPEALEFIALAEEIGRPTAYLENQIHMPTIANCRRQLAALEAKFPVRLVRSAEEHGGPHEPWFWDPTRQGGGVWCDMGCHSAAVGKFMLTPQEKPFSHLKAVSVNASMALLKWGSEPFLSQLRKARGVDYSEAGTPAEDFALVTFGFKDPETGLTSMAVATDSWCYTAPGLRLFMEAIAGPHSYAVNTLVGPSTIFISDEAVRLLAETKAKEASAKAQTEGKSVGEIEAIADAELALEKAQATRGLITVMENEALTYGYAAEDADMVNAFANGRNGLLTFEDGLQVTRMVMAGYMAHEDGHTLDLTDPLVTDSIDKYIPAIQEGRGAEVLFR